MSDFTNYVQTELPFRTSIDVIAATGSLLVKVNNSFSRDYQALSQGTLDQVLVSAGANSAPGWTQSLVLLSLEVDNITINGAAITSSTGAISFADENLTTSGIINCSHIKAASGQNLVLEPDTEKAFQADSSGYARGAYSVDLQTNRDADNKVASGIGSVICGGYGNRASTNYTAVLSGLYNQCTSAYSVVCGGHTNTINSTQAIICGGRNNSIGSSCDYAFIGGGRNGAITGAYAIIIGGYYNAIQGYRGVICGGDNCLIETAAQYGVILNGFYAKVKKPHGVAAGRDPISKNYGEYAQSSGKFNAYGDAQTSLLLARKTTTDATATVLKLDGSVEDITLDTDRSYVFCIHVVGHCDVNSVCAAYKIEGCIFCKSTTYTLKVTSTTVIYEDEAGWNTYTTVSGGILYVYVVGAVSRTINWLARVELTQVGK